MKKDVIYVDIEDDITSIIEKVKASPVKIVALVPPKRIGALQSVVNLKLLARAARSGDKRLVLITNDSALARLAAGLQLPVAKNLQSKPEVAQAAALKADDDDIITGQAVSIPAASAADLSVDEPAANATPHQTASDNPLVVTAPAAAAVTAKAPKVASKVKVPNFDTFRKKLFLAGGGAVLLLAFLVWALVYAPRATVSITAKTTSYDISEALVLKTGGTFDAAKRTLPAVVQQIQKNSTLDFDATGKKDIGDKARGMVTISNCDTSYSQTILAGTVLSGGGLSYSLDADTLVPGATFSGGGTVCQPGTSEAAAATAQAIGEQYNVASGTKFSVAGASSKVTATASAAFSGGTKQTVSIVSADDVEKAKGQLVGQNVAAVKTELKSQLGKKVVVIEESFFSQSSTPQVTPAVGEQTKRATLTAQTTYSYVAIARSDMDKLLDAVVKDATKDQASQKVYENGDDSLRFADFAAGDGGNYQVRVRTTAQAGPNIDETAAAKQMVGKRAGEIQQQLKAVEGVDDVQVEFSPFWVSTAPSADKITITFLVKHAS